MTKEHLEKTQRKKCGQQLWCTAGGRQRRQHKTKLEWLSRQVLCGLCGKL